MAKKKFPWLGVSLGIGGLLALTGFAHAKEKTPEEVAAERSQHLHDLLNAAGFATFATYTTADSESEQISDAILGSTRQLPQSLREQFLGFMWDTNALLRFGNFDMANWDRYTERYDALVPQFEKLKATMPA